MTRDELADAIKSVIEDKIWGLTPYAYDLMAEGLLTIPEIAHAMNCPHYAALKAYDEAIAYGDKLLAEERGGD